MARNNPDETTTTEETTMDAYFLHYSDETPGAPLAGIELRNGQVTTRNGQQAVKFSPISYKGTPVTPTLLTAGRPRLAALAAAQLAEKDAWAVEADKKAESITRTEILLAETEAEAALVRRLGEYGRI